MVFPLTPFATRISLLILLFLTSNVLVSQSSALIQCNFSRLADAGPVEGPQQTRGRATCRCDGHNLGKRIFYFVAGGHEDIKQFCDLSGHDSSSDAEGTNAAVSLAFRGGSNVVVDGALELTAAGLDITSNGPIVPLLRFSNIHNLELRNLVFRDLNISGPLILIEECTNVTIRNVTLERVKVLTTAAVGHGGATIGTRRHILAAGGLTSGDGETAQARTSSTQSPLLPDAYGVYGGGLNFAPDDEAADLAAPPAVDNGDATQQSTYGGALWLRNTSDVDLQDVHVALFEVLDAPLHGILLTAGSNVSATGVTVHSYTADMDGSTGCCAVLVHESLVVTVSKLACSSSQSSSGPCITVIDSDSVEIIDSTFINNTVGSSGSSRFGGAICLKSTLSAAAVWIVGSTFISNTAVTGGALALLPSSDAGAMLHVNVRSCNFSSNRATVNGGDMYLGSGSVLSVSSSSFLNSEASKTGCPGNSRDYEDDLYRGDPTTTGINSNGGSIYGVGSRATFRRSTFERCCAHGGAGGALYFSHGPSGTPASVTLDGCSFNMSSSGSGGGALAVHLTNTLHKGMLGEVDITNTVFFKNKGGAVLLKAEGGDEGSAVILGKATFHNVDISENKGITGGVVEIQGWSLEIEGGVWADNAAPDYHLNNEMGGGLLVRGCTNVANISNVEFKNNWGHLGGAIAADWCSLAVRNCTFTNNGVTREGGAILMLCYRPDRSTYERKKEAGYKLSLYGSAFYGNRAGDFGGGISVSCGNALVSDSRFISNYATTGAAIMLDRSGATNDSLYVPRSAVLTNVSFINNAAEKSGGGLYATDWYLTLKNVDFVNNTIGAMEQVNGDVGGAAVYTTKCRGMVTIRNITCINNTAGQGGAVVTDLTNMTVTNANFTGNKAVNEGGRGGGAFLAFPFMSNFAQITYVVHLQNATFSGNVAAGDGGALKAEGTAIVATDVIFMENNAAEGRGGAVHVKRVPLVSSPGADVTASFNNCSFTGNSARLSGGAMYHETAAVQLTRCRFSGSAVLSGKTSRDGWLHAGGAIFAKQCAQRMVVNDSDMWLNRAPERGGAAVLLSCAATFTGCHLHNNTAKLAGGAVAVGLEAFGDDPEGLALMFRSCNLTENQAETEHGGALYVVDVPLHVEGSRLVDNTAQRMGGAAYVDSSTALTFLGTVIEGNKANASSGGGLWARALNQSRASFQRVSVQGNICKTTGGGIWLSGWSLDIQSSDFLSNRAGTFAVAGLENSGGALYMADCGSGAGNISDSTFVGNTAYQGGALLSAFCSLSLRNATFEGNTAVKGDAGAISAIGVTGGGNDSSIWKLRDTTFRNNTAGGRAGGFKAYAISLTVHDSYFLANNATSAGGAVYLELVPPEAGMGANGSTMKPAQFDKCEFRLNSVDNSGGALHHASSAVSLTHCTLYGNSAGVEGFAGNSAGVAQGTSTAGGAIFATSCTSDMAIRSSELGGNQAGGRGGALALLSCHTTLEDSNIFDNVASLSGGGATAGHQPTRQQPEAPMLSFLRCNLTRNKASLEDGGAIHVTSVPLTLNDCRLANNTAKRYGGAVSSIYSPSVVLSSSILKGNRAGSSGGAVWLEGVKVVQLYNSTITENTAVASGGGLCLSNPSCTHLQDVTLEGNAASRGGGLIVAMPDLTDSPAAAGLTCPAVFDQTLGYSWKKRLSVLSRLITVMKGNDTVAVVVNISATGNRAQGRPGHGGAALFEATRGTILLDNITATLNTAGSGGGAIAWIDSRVDGASLYLVSSNLSGNSASVRGGAIAMDGSTTHQQVVLSDSTLRSNTAGRGGAVSVQLNASLALRGCVLEGNLASGSGGGGAVHASSCKWLLVDQTNITSSTASLGHGGGVHSDSCQAVVLTQTELRGNVAAGSGGGVLLTGPTAATDDGQGHSLGVILSGSMEGNTAGAASGGVGSSSAATNLPDGSGGALSLGGRLTVALDGTSFGNNWASTHGGGVGIGIECPQAPSSSSGHRYGAVAPSPPSRGLEEDPSFWPLPSMPRLTAVASNLAASAGHTLQALLGASLKRGYASRCWAAVFNQPRLWNNTARGSGGAAYVSSPYTLALRCDDEGWVRTDQKLAGLIADTSSYTAPPESAVSTSSFSGGGGGGGSGPSASYMGMLPTTASAKAACFRPPPSAIGSEAGSSPATAGNSAGEGYGDAIATAPKLLALAGLKESKDTTVVSTYLANRLSISASIDAAAGAQAVGNGSASGGRGGGNRALLADITDATGAVNRSGSATSSGGGSGEQQSTSATALEPVTSSTRPLWLWRAAVLQADGRVTAVCWPGQGCVLVLPTNVAVEIDLSLFDAVGQVANDTKALRPVVRATLNSTDPKRRADLLGNPIAEVITGTASLAGVRVHAAKGHYRLTLALDTDTNMKVTPLVLNVTVPPCTIGELSMDGGSLCSKCSANTYSLRVDKESDDDTSQTAASPWKCSACPFNGNCTGGAVVIPLPGYWHSAANSTAMHQCPNPVACRRDDMSANEELVRCQDRWYDYFGALNRFSQLEQDGRGGTAVVGEYLEVYRDALARGVNASLRSPLAPGGVFDGFLMDCALWGVSSDDGLSYMKKQCAQGYSGILCATCAKEDGNHYALLSDMTCTQCFNKAASIAIGVAFFIANTLWLGFSVLMTFLTDYRFTQQEDGLPAADLLKVLIVHYQFFLIVTRININWPNSVMGLQSALGSITGSVKQVYSPSCLWPGANSAQQATVQVLTGLLLPIFSVVVVMILWIIRYIYWNQKAWLTATFGGRGPSLPRSTTFRTRGAPAFDELIANNNALSGVGDNHCSERMAAEGINGSGAVSAAVATIPEEPLQPQHAPASTPQPAAAFRAAGVNPAGMDKEGRGSGDREGSLLREAPYVGVAGRAQDGVHDGGDLRKCSPSVGILLDDEPPEAPPTSSVGAAAIANTAAAAPAAPASRADPPRFTESAATATAPAAAPAPAVPSPPASSKPPPLLTSRYAPASSGTHQPVSCFADAQYQQLLLTPSIPDPPALSPSGLGSRQQQSPIRQAGRATPVDDSKTTMRVNIEARSRKGSSPASLPSTSSSQQRARCDKPAGVGAAGSLAQRPSGTSELKLLRSHEFALRRVPLSSSMARGHSGKLHGLGSEPQSSAGSKSIFPLFSQRESLSFVDANMSLTSQLFLVLMVTSFVLMPTFATEALSIFSCYKLDEGSGEYAENQKATAPYGYWVRDMNQECYTGRHLHFWVPIGAVSVVVLCLAMPLVCAALMVHRRNRLNEIEVVHVYGFLYRSYKEKYYFWESVTQAQTLLLVVVEVFGRTLWVLHQALLLEVVLLAVLMINTYFSPLVHDQLTALQLLSLGTICMTVVLGMFTSLPLAQISNVNQTLLGAMILLINCLIIIAFLVLFVIHVLPTLKDKAAIMVVKLRSSLSQLTSVDHNGRPSMLQTGLSWISTKRNNSASSQRSARLAKSECKSAEQRQLRPSSEQQPQEHEQQCQQQEQPSVASEGGGGGGGGESLRRQEEGSATEGSRV